MKRQDQYPEGTRWFAEKVAALGEVFGVRVESTAWSEPHPLTDCCLVTVATEDIEVSAILSRHWLEDRPGGDIRRVLTGIARALALKLAQGSANSALTRALPAAGAVVPSSSPKATSPKEMPCKTS